MLVQKYKIFFFFLCLLVQLLLLRLCHLKELVEVNAEYILC